MSRDPLSRFGGLSQACIRDEYVKDDKMAAAGVLVMLLGMGSSLATVYILSVLGSFV